MIEAHLYFRDVCFKVMRLDATYPPKTIRECSVEPVQVESWADMSPIDEKQKLNIWIYILVNRIGQFAFKYEFRVAAVWGSLWRPDIMQKQIVPSGDRQHSDYARRCSNFSDGNTTNNASECCV